MAEVIPHWLTKQADLQPNGLAIEMDNGEKITFHELKDKSEELAKKMAALGIKKNDHIGILSTNSITMVAIIHALSYLGAVSVLLNIRLTEREINFQLSDADVSMLLTAEDLIEQGRKTNAETVITFSELEQVPKKEVELADELNLDDSFTIIYTSGTTGFPKGVVHTYGNHWWSAISSALNLGLNQTDKWLIPLPVFHVSGLSTMMKSVIYGMPVYLLKKFDTEKMHHAIMFKNITIASVVTMMVRRLVERLPEGERYPEQLRCLLLGGGPAPESLLEKAKEKQIPVFQSYGMTETTSQIVTLSAQDALRKIGSAGKPLMPAQLQIKPLGKDDPIGEIQVKGPMVTKGYYKRERENQELFDSGWLHTGDLGYIDEEGYLYVVDRRSDLIISGGENIYPTEIENVLAEIPQVREAAVTGKADEEWGEVPIAFVVMREEIQVEFMMDYLKRHLAKFKLPKEIHFVEELPRNASNKLVRKKLKVK
jgi:O-succinylbenzoic acid--CoA ligase